MIQKIVYGTDDGKKFYIQSVCDHIGCLNCNENISFGEDIPEAIVEKCAEGIAKALKVPVVRW